VEESERWTKLIPVLVSVECPQCGHQVERLLVLHLDKAEIIEEALRYKFSGIIYVKVLRGEELIDFIRGRR